MSRLFILFFPHFLRRDLRFWDLRWECRGCAAGVGAGPPGVRELQVPGPELGVGSALPAPLTLRFPGLGGCRSPRGGAGGSSGPELPAAGAGGGPSAGPRPQRLPGAAPGRRPRPARGGAVPGAAGGRLPAPLWPVGPGRDTRSPRVPVGDVPCPPRCQAADTGSPQEPAGSCPAPWPPPAGRCGHQEQHVCVRPPGTVAAPGVVRGLQLPSRAAAVSCRSAEGPETGRLALYLLGLRAACPPPEPGPQRSLVTWLKYYLEEDWAGESSPTG